MIIKYIDLDNNLILINSESIACVILSEDIEIKISLGKDRECYGKLEVEKVKDISIILNNSKEFCTKTIIYFAYDRFTSIPIIKEEKYNKLVEILNSLIKQLNEIGYVFDRY